MSILVLDVGSSSVRALLLDEAARLIPGALVSRPHQFQTEATGAVVADAVALRALVERCLDDLLSHPQAATIQAVGMAVFVGNLLGLDAAGQPLTPLYTYADTRAHAQVEELRPLWTNLYQQTGCPPHTAYHPPKLAWLQATQPVLYAQVAQWTDLATYCYQTWLGVATCSYSVAAWSGLLNRQTLQWEAAWLAELGLSAHQWPVLADYTAAQVGLVGDYRRRWPALAEVPFYLAVGDGAAANVGSGAVGAGQAALTLGTTAALRRVLEAETVPPVPEGLWGYRVDAGRHLLGGATSEGGNIYQWALQTLAWEERGGLEAALAGRAPGQHGLSFLPLLAGERSPGWAAQATGTLTGLRLATTPLDILQAGLEGVAVRLALLAAQLRRAGPIEQVLAGGGALLGSPTWAQMICNALDQPLDLLAEPEVTARGVGILVLSQQQGRPWADFPPRLGPQLQPQAQWAEAWQNLRTAQAQVYAKMVKESPNKG